MKYAKTKNFSISKKARWSLGSLFLVGVTALLIAILSFQHSLEVYASTDPGLDSGNATVDRSSVPGQTILKYTTTGTSTFKAPAGVTDVRVMAIGGGGGGGAGEGNPAGDAGGGGGAGEYRHETSFAVTPGAAIGVTVGGGGGGSTAPNTNGAPPSTAGNGASGGNSVFGSLTIRGGGGGGAEDIAGVAGGSGGGSGGHCTNGATLAGGASTAVSPGVGNAGGTTPSGSCTPRGAAGGGGAGAVGASGSGSGGGGGAIGLQNNITGTNSFYAAGGGGGGGSNSGGGANGGSSIGGKGGNASGGNGAIGTANTGSGGGGGGTTSTVNNATNGHGGNGGSGIVIVRFATQTLPDPGGVAGTRMWYKADSAGNTNSQWNDVSGFSHNLTQGTAGNQPALTTNALNFNPAYVFDGTDDVFRMTTQGIGANESMSVFYAGTSTTTAGGDRYFNEFGDDRPSITIYNGKPRLYVRDTSSIDDQYGSEEALQPHVYSFVSPNGGGTKVLGVDNNEQTKTVTGTYTTGGGATGTSFGGRNASSGTSWQGPIAEAIYFNRQLTATERQQVNSYLALKYGISLGSGVIATAYLNSAGATIWPADNTYKNNVAGIGRDDNSTLNQKQSKSSVDGSLVTIGHGGIAASNQANANNFTNNQTSMVWGHDAGDTTTSTVVDDTYVRMDRIWKTVVTNTVGSTKVQIPTSAVPFSNNGVLYVSSSPTFDAGAQKIPMTANGANYEADMTLAPGTHYFSFGAFTGSDIEVVSKTATDTSNAAITSYTPGQPLEYHINVKNNGPDAAGVVTVTDVLPDGIVPTTGGSTGNAWGCGVSGQTVTCTLNSLASGATAEEILIEATVASSVTGQKVNTANASVANDPDLSNNSAGVTLDAAPKADLSLTKADMSTPVAGANFDYKFSVTNNGPSDVSSYTITDTLPSDLTYVSASPDICGASSGQSVSCTGTTLTSGQTVEVTLTVHVDGGYAGGDLINTATVAVPSGVTDPNTSNNSSTNNTSVDLSTDLTISKTHTGNFIAGENNTFEVTVTNNGPSDAPINSISITDTLDEDFSYVSATGTGWSGCANSNGTITCDYDAALTNTSVTPALTITVAVDPIAKGTTTNTATVSGTTPDPNMTNNSSTDNITIDAEADLAITKTAVGNPFVSGTQERFSFSVVNNGPSADTPTYTITDTLPAEFTYAGTTPDSAASCSVVGQDITCDGGGMEVGDPAQVTTIIVDVDPTANTSVDNTAIVATDPSVTDPTPANNSSTVTVDFEPNADLAISKSAPATITAGDTADYTLTTENNGPSSVASYTVTDALDPNLTYQSSSPNVCSVTGTTPQGGEEITCTGGSIAASGQDAITVTVGVDTTATPGSTISNSATVEVPVGTNDPDTTNNTSTTVNSTVGTEADLAITKTHTGNFSVGGSGSFTISATNNGPSDATTATITDVLPDGMTYVSATSPNASCSNAGQTVTCTVGPSMSNGQTVDITLDVTVDPDVTVTSIENTASIASSTTDPNTGNNSDSDTVTIDPAEANLTATKTAQGSLMAGESATYRFEVTNDGGPDNAGVVTIHDTLPSYLSYQSFDSVSGGTWDCSASGQDVTCTLPVLNVDDTAVVDITVLVAQDAPDTANNSASTTFNGTDSTPANPSTTDPVSHEADLEAKLSHEQKTYRSGDTVNFTYTVINHGPSTATDVVLTDTLPSGLNFESIVATHQEAGDTSLMAQVVDTVLGSTPASAAPNTPFSCSNSGQNITCNASSLAVGTYTLQMTAQIADNFTGDLTSMLAISSATPDPNSANNSSSDTIQDVLAALGGLAGTGQNIFTWILLAGVVISLPTALIVRQYKIRARNNP